MQDLLNNKNCTSEKHVQLFYFFSIYVTIKFIYPEIDSAVFWLW